MELKTNRAVIAAAEPAGSLMQEQSVELDYVLPDYYPDVCKLVKCFVTPAITGETVSGDRVSYELRAEVRILYCGEDSHILQCVCQTLHFSRTAELGVSGEGVSVELIPVTDYVNCRAVSRRRLDVRGAVTVRIRTNAARQQEAICDIFEKSVQLKKVPVQYPVKSLQTTRNLVIAEELELGNSKPPVLHIVRCDARTVEESHKMVSGKLLVQGNLQIQLLYACEKDGDGSLEPMSFQIPYSQLLELEGMEEQDNCSVRTTVAACDIKPVTDAGGDVHILRCEAELRISCSAVRMATESLACDAFSTEHRSRCITEKVCTAGTPEPFSEMHVCSTKLACTDCELDCVYDAWCEIKNLTTRMDTQTCEVQFSGMLCCCVLVRESGGMPRLLEREEPFEHRLYVPDLCEQDSVQVYAAAENCSYTLSEQAEVSLKAELRLEGMVSRSTICEVLTGFEVEEDAAHPRNHALKLYFGKAQEEIWEIAKRCHTSVAAIMEENDLTEEILTADGMLLIPIVN
ncbi:MAG: DUF3794 domain-containing protein [Ruminococcus sp.]|nr:DUF3794 domain-containing protein [Ruminococcus sp.]